MKKQIGIIGSTGYTGVVLTRLLLFHPEIKITLLTSEQHAGKYYYEIYPSFYDFLKLKCKKLSIAEAAELCDVLFFATPNGFSREFLPKIINRNPNLKIIDLSADFRLKRYLTVRNKKIKIAYGLPEIHRNEIKNSAVIANPGCYPTSILLGLAPVIKSKMVNLNSLIADSKSGTSGAGRSLKQELHFSEVNESFNAYKLAGTHRHIPEIENELSKLASSKINIVFSPHLLPINRGIFSTIYAELKNKKFTQKDIFMIYKNYYKNESFIKVLPKTIYPEIKHVKLTNYCYIRPLIDKRTNKLIVLSVIDNMVKGAAGQAIQNMNLILSLDERLGLDSPAHIP